MSEVQLTDDQKVFVQRGIESGRYIREEGAIHEALELWEELERTRAKLLATIDFAEASAARSEGIFITPESVRSLAGSLKQQG